FTLGHTYSIAKLANSRCRVTPAAHTAYGRHTRIVPAGYMFLVYQLQQFPFAHNGIRKVTAGKLVLAGWEYLQFFDEPVIQGAVVYELKRTDRMRDVFDAIALPMGKIIHRVNTPLISAPVMMCMFDAVHQRIAQQQVGVGHIYFCT